MGPPELLGFGLFGGEAGVDEGFAVGDVGSVDGAEPVAFGHFVGGEIAPTGEDVAFVLDLVVDDGLFPGVEPAGGGGEVIGLEAGVGDGGAGVVVHDVRVVDGAHVLVGVVLLDELEETGELGGGLGADEVELVGEGPPDVAIGTEAGDDVAEVAVVDLRRESGVAPAVVGVEEDEVGLDVHVAEAAEELFVVAKEFGVEVVGVV